MYSIASLRDGGSASGTARDTAGVQSVRGQLFRVADSRYWNGSSRTTVISNAPAQGTTQWTFGFPILSTGQYAFRATALDYVGGIGYPATVNFSVGSGTSRPPKYKK
jgi:hypothetical protein